MNKIVNTNGLNMRKGAGTNYSVIRVLIKNTELEVIWENSGWSKIKYNNEIGYVATRYLTDKIISKLEGYYDRQYVTARKIV